MQTSNIERDTFLWEKMGRCYHEDIYVYFDDYYKHDGGGWQCKKCNDKKGYARTSGCYSSNRWSEINPNFSSNEGFKILWDWCQKQIWLPDFERDVCGALDCYPSRFLKPDYFANAIWEYIR